MTCGVEFVKWFWTGPWLVTCRLDARHDGEHGEVPSAATYPPDLRASETGSEARP